MTDPSREMTNILLLRALRLLALVAVAALVQAACVVGVMVAWVVMAR